jgi:predicted protein tyrosine phosphatase
MQIRWAVTDRLCLLARPRDEDEMREIADEAGLGLLIQLFDPANPTEAATDWSKVAEEYEFEVRRIEAPDFGAPRIDPASLAELATKAREIFEDDGAVGMHCNAGIGRTGTMALLLMAELIRQNGSCSETSEQMDMVTDYLRNNWQGGC